MFKRLKRLLTVLTARMGVLTLFVVVELLPQYIVHFPYKQVMHKMKEVVPMKKVALLVVFCLLLPIFAGCSAKSMDLSLARPFAKHDIQIRDAAPISGTNGTPQPNVGQKWYYPQEFYDCYYVGNDKVEHISRPYLIFDYTNIGPSGVYNWLVALNVDEKTVITTPSGEQTIRYGQNSFQYHDPQIVLVCGDKTDFASVINTWDVTWDGLLWDAAISSNHTKLDVTTLSCFRQNSDISLPIGADTELALKIAAEAENNTAVMAVRQGQDILRGRDSAVAVGGRLEGCYLSKDTYSDDFMLQGDRYMQTYSVIHRSSQGQNETVGAFVVKLNVYNTSNKEFVPITIEIPFHYTVTD